MVTGLQGQSGEGDRSRKEQSLEGPKPECSGRQSWSSLNDSESAYGANIQKMKFRYCSSGAP